MGTPRRLRGSVWTTWREPSRGAYRLGVVPQTQYARKGDAHIAYQIVGEGNTLDIVLVSTWFSHVEARWDLPGYAHYLRRLSSFSRLISFDKYGIGLSDPIPSKELPPLEDWMDDVSAVMDAVGLERAAIVGAGEASPMAELFAATYPERTSALVLLNATARISAAPGYEIGAPPEVRERLVAMAEQTWGRGDVIAAINPSLAGDAVALEAWGRFLRLSASPATAAAVMRMLFELDVRDVLPAIRVPTLVVHRQDNPIVTVDQGRYVADQIEGTKFVAVPGADYGLAVGDVDVLIDEVEEFLTGSRPAHATDRVLATVLFTDIVDSTPRAVELGDARWRELLERHDELAETEVARFGGAIADFTGDGLLASFEGPARAVRCAVALRDRLRKLGLEMSAGLHTGEVERRSEGIAGIGVHIAARVLALAGAGEVFVSRTVRDLVTGSGLTFVERGTHTLKGVPDQWEILEAIE
jgi:class 3 adenylate cyclase